MNFDQFKALLTNLVTAGSRLLEKISSMLVGEPARVIGYGAAVVIFLVARASGVIPDVSFEQAVVNALAAVAVIASVIESIRHFVYSPPTVGRIIDATIATADYKLAVYEDIIKRYQQALADIAQTEANSAAKQAAQAKAASDAVINTAIEGS